ncbi:MAG: three-Cys-motif partner protein TcmP [Archaeoglobaceae archaeon]|nr:three-Cys-motif partner protein TcmP [Archaeoglobaceae archaeon]
MPRRKTPFEWWQDRISTLTGYKDEAKRLYSFVGSAYPQGYWTLLKLAIFAYYIDVYTVVAKSNFNRILYIDLFAGSGLNEIEINKHKEILLGSALLAEKVPRRGKEFDEIILVEQDPEKAAVLKQLLPESTVINDDCNSPDTLKKILDRINEEPRTHFLAVMDPEGLELKWSTVQTLIKLQGDSVINYMCAGVGRSWGNVYSSKQQDSIKVKLERTLTEFFGNNKWKNCVPPTQGGSVECLFDLYFNQVKEFKQNSVPITVRGIKGFHYHIIVAVGRTRGTQGWIDAIYRAKYQIEKIK